MQIKEMVERTKKLNDSYNENELLEVVKQYKSLLNRNDIEVNLWVDAIEELLENIEENRTTIKSIIDEAAHIINKHDELLSKYKKKNTITYKSLLVAPIFLLQVVYINNSKHYKGDLYVFNNSKFEKAMGDK